MNAIGQSLGDDVCKALPGMHALTGCDSTSALVRKANVKRQAFRMVESESNICAVLMLTVRKQRRIHGQSSIQMFCSKNTQICYRVPFALCTIFPERGSHCIVTSLSANK